MSESIVCPRVTEKDEAFWKFHEAHPAVYTELRDLCRAWVSKGIGRWSMWGAFSVLRWERRMAGLPDPEEEYKLNNNYTSYYARLLMQQEPELVGLFEIREQGH